MPKAIKPLYTTLNNKYSMNYKFLGIVFAILLIASFTFAAPTVTVTSPGTLTTGSQTTLTITLKDENNDSNSIPDELYLYYSTNAGGYENAIILDTNLNDGVGIQCADNNFVTAKPCTYSWSVPSSLTPYYYYIDANFIVNPEDTNYLGSSSAFKIETTQGCATLLWTMGIIGMMLCFFIIMKFMGEGMPVKMMVTLAISGIVAIVIIVSFTGGVCVV